MPVVELFIEYRAEFGNLFVDVEDNIATLVEELQAPDAAIAVPGADVLNMLRASFARTDYDAGPVRTVSLVKAVCTDAVVGDVLRGCGADLENLLERLSELEEDSDNLFRGWIPRLFRSYWHRGTWTPGFAKVLALASLEAGARHRAMFSCTDVLLMSWVAEPAVRTVLSDVGLSRLKLRRYLAHGLAEDAPIRAAAHPSMIRIHRDPYSTQELVTYILQNVLESPEPHDVFARVIDLGSASVGPFAPADAVERIEIARSMAAADDAPLLLTIDEP